MSWCMIMFSLQQALCVHVCTRMCVFICGMGMCVHPASDLRVAVYDCRILSVSVCVCVWVSVKLTGFTTSLIRGVSSILSSAESHFWSSVPVTLSPRRWWSTTFRMFITLQVLLCLWNCAEFTLHQFNRYYLLSEVWTPVQADMIF